MFHPQSDGGPKFIPTFTFISFDDINHEDTSLFLLSKSSYGPRWRDAWCVSVYCIHRTPGKEMGLDNATDLENYMLI